MEIYSTEEQQAEAIKSFFRDNGVALLLGAALGLGGLYGWRAYNEHAIATSETTSDAFTQLVSKAGQADSSLLADADAFISSNSDSNYAVLAAFVSAKEAVDNDQLAKAAEKLTWVTEKSSNIDFKAIAYTRLARIQLEQKQYDQALATLNRELPASFIASIEELKGDIFVAKNDNEQARSAYQAAADAGGLDNNGLLQLKLDNLAVKAPAI